MRMDEVITPRNFRNSSDLPAAHARLRVGSDDGGEHGGRMAERKEMLGPRICQAADAVLGAMYELEQLFPEGVPFPPVVLRAMPSCPDAMKEYTSDEIESATGFLLRLGMLTRV